MLLNIYIILTRNCNLNCHYCPVKKENKNITIDTIQRICNLIKMSDFEDIFLTFHGGEPLLEFEKIVYFINTLKEINNKNFYFFTSTNGTLLSPSRIKYLKENNCNLRISCDGVFHSHSLYRRAKSQGDDFINYKTILKNILLCVKYNILTKINIVVTPNTVKYLYNNYLFLNKFKVEFVEISPAIGIKWNKESLSILSQQLKKIRMIHNQLPSHSHPNFQNNINNKIIETEYFLGRSKKYNNSLFFVIDYDGEIYSDEFDKETKKYLYLNNIFNIDNYYLLINNTPTYFELIYKLWNKDMINSLRNSYEILLSHYNELKNGID